jgi:hypothetical protein
VVNEAALPCFSHNNIENVGKYRFYVTFCVETIGTFTKHLLAIGFSTLSTNIAIL